MEQQFTPKKEEGENQKGELRGGFFRQDTLALKFAHLLQVMELESRQVGAKPNQIYYAVDTRFLPEQAKQAIEDGRVKVIFRNLSKGGKPDEKSVPYLCYRYEPGPNPHARDIDRIFIQGYVDIIALVGITNVTISEDSFVLGKSYVYDCKVKSSRIIDTSINKNSIVNPKNDPEILNSFILGTEINLKENIESSIIEFSKINQSGKIIGSRISNYDIGGAYEIVNSRLLNYKARRNPDDTLPKIEYGIKIKNSCLFGVVNIYPGRTIENSTVDNRNSNILTRFSKDCRMCEIGISIHDEHICTSSDYEKIVHAVESRAIRSYTSLQNNSTASIDYTQKPQAYYNQKDYEAESLRKFGGSIPLAPTNNSLPGGAGGRPVIS